MKKSYYTPNMQTFSIFSTDVLTESKTDASTSNPTSSQAATVKQGEMLEALYDVYLTGFNKQKKLELIRAVMDHSHIGLKVAKDMVEGCESEQQLIKAGLTENEMLVLKNLLTQAGASVQIVTSGKKETPQKTTNNTTAVCRSKIFINGGEPIGTDCMGILMVDDPDRYVIINYSEAPIEVDVTPGRHFVAIGAGEHFSENMPSLKREFDFEKDTVLTVDIAAVTDTKGLWNGFGGDSDAVIRFQKITYAEYEKALGQVSFKVTKKTFN